MLRHAVAFLAGMLAVLSVCVACMDRGRFLVAAIVIIPLTTVLFHLYERHSFSAYRAAKR